ncbi:MAG: MGMT family protein [Candidatus Methylacidiphilales bacterium]
MSRSETTAFQRRVLDRVREIPCGKVVTYLELARAVGIRSARAIGQALKSNPDAPMVPCHRVIRSDLSLGGYQGKTEGLAVRRKMRLLAAEGVVFDHNHRLVGAEDRLFRFDVRLDYSAAASGCPERAT